MRKLFLLISAFLLAATVSADPIGPNNSETTVTNALADAISAASPNDVIELSDGIYKEAGSGALIISKNLTIQAAEGAHPVIAQKCYFVIAQGAQVTFKGIKFDGSIYTANDHCLRAYNGTPASNGAEILTLEDCEFTRFPSYIIYTQRDDRRWDAITIRNCYFYNNASYAIVINPGSTHQSCNSLTIQNSTFAGFTGSSDVIFYDAPDAEHTTSLTMNHCTFYNHPRCAISWQKSTNLNVTNCIFAQPSAVDYKSIDCAGGSITNCLSYNSNGYSSAATPTGNLTGNPYFMNTNPANYDFTIWTTSPAHGTADDGYDLGDYLRWNTDPATHVATINITADDANSLKAAVDAALPGDEIILAAGTYEESESISLDKEITIKAADGASPIVKPVGNFAIRNGVDITFQNIKFDGFDQSGVLNLIYAADNSANNLTVEGCQFYSFSNKVFYAASDKKLICSVDDCYFRNNTHVSIDIENTAAANLTVTNSTFANIDASGADYIGIIDTKTATGVVRIDHCTFYDCKTKSTDYGVIGHNGFSATDVVVSNCIFAWSTTYDKRATYLPSGTAISNCLTYNTNKDTDKWGHHSGPTFTKCMLADPLFNDLEHNKYTYDGNYATGSISPARKAGTDGSDLGDPRWYTAATYPETDFAAPDYVFTASKAKLTGSIVYEIGGPDDPYIRYNRTSTPGEAEWVIKATRACYVQAIVNMVDNKWNAATDATKFQNHKHIFTVELLDSNNTPIGSVTEGPWTEDGYGGEDWYGDVTLPGYIHIANPGVYTVKLYNTRTNSRCGVGSVTISYMGGDTQTITNTADFETDINDAWFTSCGTRADGKISFSGDAVASEWVRWNVTVANSDYYDITINSDYESGHIYSVTFYDGETQVARVAESAWHNTTGALDLGRRFLPAGNYVMEIKNSVSSNSDAKIVSVEAVAFVAPVIALPNTLPAASAITSELAYEDGGELYFTPSDKRGYILDQWAKWKVSVASAGLFLFTMNVTSSNEQSYVVTILDSENHELESFAKNPGTGDKTIKHYFNLAAGNYFVMVQNTTNHSAGHIVSFVVTKPDDVVTIDENATSNSAWVGKIDESTYDVQIIRSFAGGMYNTFCLPFDVSSSQCKEVFGADVEIYTLGSATIEDNILNLDVDPASDIYPGTPVLIKPSHDIVNPVFTDVEFTAATASSTPKTNANFVGSFVKTPLTASEDLLYVGPDNQVFFLSVDYDMPGMRAWFVIHDVPAALGSPKALRSARIIEREQTATSIQHVDQPNAAASKVLIDGQIIIIRGNEKFNIQGQNIQ